MNNQATFSRICEETLVLYKCIHMALFALLFLAVTSEGSRRRAQRSSIAQHALAHPLDAAAAPSSAHLSKASGGEISKAGGAQHHQHESGNKGEKHSEKVTHGSSEAGGHHSSHQGGGGHSASNHDEKAAGHGSKYQGHEAHGKANSAKGYRDKYHKDEAHHVSKFWSNGQERGSYHKFGDHGSHFKDAGGHKNQGVKTSKSGHSDSHGKKGKYMKAQHNSDHKGFDGSQGKHKSHAHHASYARKSKKQSRH